jgi:hypothetical protein
MGMQALHAVFAMLLLHVAMLLLHVAMLLLQLLLLLQLPVGCSWLACG